MANYANAKATIAANIYTNHTGQVTAEMVKTAADAIVDTLIAGGYLYAGVAKLTPTQTNPGSPDANVFYIATEPGTYTNFVGAGGSLVVAEGEVAIFKFNGTWSKEVTGAATAAQVTELGQEINLLNFNPTIYTLATYPQNPMGISGGFWDANEGRTHIAIPAVVGMSIAITANANGRALINFLKSYAPKPYTPVQYSDATGYNDRIVLNANETGTYIVPNDCVAIVIEAASYLPVDIVLDGYSLKSNIVSAIVETINREKNEEISQVGYALIDGYLGGAAWFFNNIRKSLITKVKSGDVIRYIQQTSGAVYYTFFKSFDFSDIASNFDICSGIDFRNWAVQLYNITAPEDAVYMCVTYWVDFPDRLPIEFIINGKNLFIKDITIIDKLNNIQTANEQKDVDITNQFVDAYIKDIHYSTLQVDANSPFFFTKQQVSSYTEQIAGVRKDMSLPVKIDIPDVGASAYTIEIAENPAFENSITIQVTQPALELYWLKINSRYWYRVKNGSTLIKEGTIKTAGTRRLNPCETIYNIRDLGGQVGLNGKKIRQGILYRGGTTNNIVTADKTILEQYLGIELVCGLALNTVDESIFNVETFHPYNLSQFAELRNDILVRRQYIVYIRKILDFIKLGKPVLFHCNGGADRTGLMSAMFEGLCGVSENDICKDYELTSFSPFFTGETTIILSRTRRGAYNENNDGQYRDVGFGDAMKFVRSQNGNTYADKWVSLLTDSAINGDGYTALTLAEIEIIREALLE